MVGQVLEGAARRQRRDPQRKQLHTPRMASKIAAMKRKRRMRTSRRETMRERIVPAVAVAVVAAAVVGEGRPNV